MSHSRKRRVARPAYDGQAVAAALCHVLGAAADDRARKAPTACPPQAADPEGFARFCSAEETRLRQRERTARAGSGLAHSLAMQRVLLVGLRTRAFNHHAPRRPTARRK